MVRTRLQQGWRKNEAPKLVGRRRESAFGSKRLFQALAQGANENFGGRGGLQAAVHGLRMKTLDGPGQRGLLVNQGLTSAGRENFIFDLHRLRCFPVPACCGACLMRAAPFFHAEQGCLRLLKV